MADPVDLLFQQAPTSGASADLVFGDIAGGGPELVTAALSGNFPPLSFSAAAALVVEAVVTGAFPPMTLEAVAQYDSNTQRPTVGRAAGAWQVATEASSSVSDATQAMGQLPAGTASHWGIAAHLQVGMEAQQPSRFRPVSREYDAAFQRAARLLTQRTAAPHQEAVRYRTAAEGRFQGADGLHLARAARHQDGLRDGRSYTAGAWQVAAPYVGAGHHGGYESALSRVFGRCSLYQEAMRPPPGVKPGTPSPVSDPCYIPPVGNAVHLLFTEGPGTPNLVFICERHPVEPPAGETVVVPIRSIYMTVNNVTLRRIEGNVAIAATGLSLSIDSGSWTFSFSASLPREAQALLGSLEAGEPVELEAGINGVAYRLLAERIARDREFASTRVRIQGRGLAAELDAPYAPQLNFGGSQNRTAQQLMLDVLQFNGVGIGWTVAWQLTDWLVPGGAWAHQGSYITALTEIAAAAGGYLQPHPTQPILRVLPLYPAPPWQWGALQPDFQLPASATTREGIEWSRKPGYNRVFVRGQHLGVQGQVTRAGTAGDKLAPMVTDPLITHADAARQRGIAVLSDTGVQTRVSLKLPVLEETGLILPGATVRYVDDGVPRFGIVRSTDVEWSRPKLRQTLGIESHA